MSAPTGNKYAEKWTYEKTMDRLCALEYTSHNDSMLYLNMALDHCSLDEDIFSYWRRKWSRRPEILQMMKMIKQRFEVRLFRKMAMKEIPERVAMFALKHCYGWGKEPVDTTKDGAQIQTDQFAYVDQQLIEEPNPSVTPITQPETPQTPKPQPSIRPKPAGDKDVSWLKRDQYNRANPQNKILEPLDYYLGEPPAGVTAIRFEKGYFWKGQG